MRSKQFPDVGKEKGLLGYGAACVPAKVLVKCSNWDYRVMQSEIVVCELDH